MNERNIYFPPGNEPPAVGEDFYLNDISTHQHIHGIIRSITVNEELGGYDVVYTIL